VLVNNTPNIKHLIKLINVDKVHVLYFNKIIQYHAVGKFLRSIPNTNTCPVTFLAWYRH